MMRSKLSAYLDKHLPDIFDAMIEKAKKGDVQASRELFDRAYGKSAQPIWHGDNEGNEITYEFDDEQLKRIARRIQNGVVSGPASLS